MRNNQLAWLILYFELVDVFLRQSIITVYSIPTAAILVLIINDPKLPQALTQPTPLGIGSFVHMRMHF